VQAFFPAGDVKILVELISAGDIKATEAAARIVDTTEANLNHDAIKVESVLKNILQEAGKEILKNNRWLEKFINMYKFINTDFTLCSNTSCLKDIFTGTVGKLVSYINLLKCRGNVDGIAGQVCSYVLENIDECITLQAAANALYMNKTYISQVFKQKTGITFVEYITKVKIERGKRLLKGSGLKTYEICSRLGFKDVEYFSKLFKKYAGMAPGEFRQANSGKE
jgi:two-component system response regulator YesN